MVQKFHLVTTLAVLVLFFLPWIDIQCSQTSIATQSGIQTIYGGASPSKQLEDSLRDEPSGDREAADDTIDSAPLVGMAFLDVLAAVVVSFLALRSGSQKLTMLVGILCAGALVILSIQMSMGFPAESSLTADTQGDPSSAFGGTTSDRDLAAAVSAMVFEIRYLPSLYITLVLLGLPTLMLANDFLDKLRKS